MGTNFGYFINLDERGSFSADVRDVNDKTVFDIRAGNELGEDESSIFDDGFMKHKDDLVGLQEHLVNLGILQADDQLLGMREFEEWQKNEALDDEVDDTRQIPRI